MARSDGFLKSKKVNRTKILPLRWIGNICSYIAIRSLGKAFDLQGNIDGFRFKFHCFIWKYFDKPYRRWGTYYEVDTKAWKETLANSESLDS